METWEAIRARRNVREFIDRPLPTEDLQRILEAGWRAPSANNRQARDFVVSTDRSQLQRLAEAWQYAGHVATSAATVTLVLPVTDNAALHEHDLYDAGQATMQMMLAAADLGIGSGHASVGDKALVRSILGLPEDKDPAYFIAFGYPAGGPLRPVQHPNRRPFNEVVHFGRW
jgi:nitroreductase